MTALELLNILPSHSVGFASKEDFKEEYRFKKSDTLLDKKFIRFNTRLSTNILVFDIDQFPLFSKKPSLQEFHNFATVMTGHVPSYTIKTEKGYHLAFILDKKTYTYRYKSEKYTQEYRIIKKLKQEITSALHADPAGSHRIAGIWRNPMTHECISTKRVYALNELAKEFNIEEKREEKIPHHLSNTRKYKLLLKKSSVLKKYLDIGYLEGNRNNYIFAKAYIALYEDRTILKKELYQIMLKENTSSSCSNLTKKEIQDIITSVYKLKETMYVFSNKKKRGILSDEMWEKAIHGIANRRRYGQAYVAKKRRNETIKKIQKALQKDITMTVKDIADDIKMGIKTVNFTNILPPITLFTFQ